MSVVRNTVEFVVLFVVWGGLQMLIRSGWVTTPWLLLIVLAVAWSKTAFFGGENIQQLRDASLRNMPYYRFMLLMLVNMWQIISSFALDYHCLHLINEASFGGINPAFTQPELIFEYFYFSVLNFTFFGYGDITPQTVPAKLLTITEIVLAFVTVIFLLSDFISLKESLYKPTSEPAANRE